MTDETQAAEGGENNFSLDSVSQDLMPKAEFTEQISQRDRKIDQLINSQEQMKGNYESQISNLTDQVSMLRGHITEQQQSARQQTYQLTEDEADALGDTVPGINKIVGQQMDARDQKIQQLENGLKQLRTQSVNTDDYAARLATLDTVIQTTADTALGMSRYLDNQDFMNWAKSQPLSSISDLTLADAYVNNMKANPADEDAYKVALSQQKKIIGLFEGSKKSDVSATPASNSVDQVKLTPTQDKLAKEIDSLMAKRTAFINNSNIPEAMKVREQILAKESEIRSSLN